jgi:hypothetical protein
MLFSNAVMRVWQIRAGSVSNEPVSWKLLRLDEAGRVVVTAPSPLLPRLDTGEMTAPWCVLSASSSLHNDAHRGYGIS